MLDNLDEPPADFCLYLTDKSCPRCLRQPGQRKADVVLAFLAPISAHRAERAASVVIHNALERIVGLLVRSAAFAPERNDDRIRS